MENKNLLLFLVLSFPFWWSCSSSHEEQPSLRQYELMEIVDRVSSDEIFSMVNVLIPETSDKSMLNSIRRIAANDSAYFILDIKGNILAFDREGKFVRKIGGFGNGPGEYTSPRDLDIDPQTGNVAVLDNNSRILLYSASDGSFSNEIKLESSAREIEMKKDVIIILRPSCPNGIPTKKEVIIIDRMTGKESGYLPALDDCTTLGINNTELSSGNSQTFITRKFDNKIYSVTDSVFPLFEIFSDKFVNSIDANGAELIKFLQSCVTDNKIFTISNFIANDSLMFFSTNIGYGLGHISDRTLKQTRSIKSSEHDITMSSCFPIAGRSDEIIFLVNPEAVNNAAQRNPDNATLIELINNLSDDSNPILFHYKLRL